MRKTRWLACVTLLLAPAPALAMEWGLGLEGAGTLGISKNLPSSSSMATSGGAGLILEERFSIALVDLSVWEDVQMPYTLNVAQSATGSVTSAQYIPVDLGLRLGLGFPVLHPYLGVLGNYSVGDSSAATSFWGVGGDLGLDVAVLFLRFGLELRALWSVSGVSNVGQALAAATAALGALVLQGLLSARFSF